MHLIAYDKNIILNMAKVIINVVKDYIYYKILWNASKSI